MIMRHTQHARVVCGLSDSFSSKPIRTRTTGRCERTRHNVPSPLAGEGQGEGWRQTLNLWSPPSLSLPRKGGGNARAAGKSSAANEVPPKSTASISP
jgi:hypothetical protein